MDALEIRARGIYAAEIRKLGRSNAADAIARGDELSPVLTATLHAIIAALTPPEGFVLVPVESVRPCGCGCERYCCTHCGTELGGFAARPVPLPSPPEGVES